MLANTLEDKKAALMHDASEAYMLDIPTPIKAKLPDYKKYEANLMSFIAKHFGFEEFCLHLIHLSWEHLVVNENDEFECWDHETAKANFIEQFNMLFNVK